LTVAEKEAMISVLGMYGQAIEGSGGKRAVWKLMEQLKVCVLKFAILTNGRKIKNLDFLYSFFFYRFPSLRMFWVKI
jgi:hypothetical protein